MVDIITDEPIVARIYKDTQTGIEIMEDTLGRFHLLPKDSTDIVVGTPVYLQASVSSPWPNTSNFHNIPGMAYTVPSGKTFSLDFITATSDKENNNVIGIFKDNVLQVSIPFGSYINFDFKNPPVFTAGNVITVRFKPPIKLTKIIVTLGGVEK
jgi:hypothetical protein